MSWWETAKPGLEITLVKEALEAEDYEATTDPQVGKAYIFAGVDPYTIFNDGTAAIKVVGWPNTWFKATYWRPLQYESDAEFLLTVAPVKPELLRALVRLEDMLDAGSK